MDKDKSMEEKIGQGLVHMGAMTKEQVAEVLKRQKQGDKRRFGQIAIELGYVDVKSIIEYLKSRGQEFFLSGSEIGLEDN